MGMYMAPSLSLVSSTLYDISDYSLYASFQVGSNGDSDGVPTSDIGDIYGEENWATYAWDTDPTNGGFDTGGVPITFSASSDGSEGLAITDLPNLTYNGASMGAIGSVIIEAAVQIPAEAKWSNVGVEFFDNGVDVQNFDIPTGPDVNTINTPSSPVADQTLTVTPSDSNCNQVVVTGTMEMRSPGIAYPASNAMFCNVFVTGS